MTQVKTLDVLVKKLDPSAKTPLYATEHSAGADLCSASSTNIIVKAGGIALVPSGISIAIPSGYEVQIRSRSGLALKNQIFVLNSPGTIDSDYRGEIKVILANFGESDFIVEPGMRIAQMVLCQYFKCNFNETQAHDQTARGQGGFGSSGV